MPENPSVSLAEGECGYEGPAQLSAQDVTGRAGNETTDRFDVDVWLLDGDMFDEFAAFIAEEHRML